MAAPLALPRLKAPMLTDDARFGVTALSDTTDRSIEEPVEMPAPRVSSASASCVALRPAAPSSIRSIITVWTPSLSASSAARPASKSTAILVAGTASRWA